MEKASFDNQAFNALDNSVDNVYENKNALNAWAARSQAHVESRREVNVALTNSEANSYVVGTTSF